MASKSADEIELEAINRMGKERGIAFTHAQQESYNLLAKWEVFWSLFENKERVDFLNNTDGFFWSIVQNSLRADIILSFCRLTDQNKQTISLHRFLKSENGDKDLKRLTDAATKKTNAYKKTRDNYVAHRNFEVTIENSIDTGLGNKEDGFDAIKSINFALNWLEKKYFDRTTLLVPLGDVPTGNVLSMLFRGEMAINQENEDWRENKIHRPFRDYPDWLLPRTDSDEYWKN